MHVRSQDSFNSISTAILSENAFEKAVSENQTSDPIQATEQSQKQEKQTLLQEKQPQSSCKSNSLLGKRKSFSQQEGCLLYCIQVMSVVNVTLGEPVLDNYIEAVKSVFGKNSTEYILSKATEKYQQINSSQIEEGEDKSAHYLEILKIMHKMIETKLNYEIKQKVSAYQTCINTCQELASLPLSNKALLTYARGGIFCENREGSLLKRIKDLIGEYWLRDLVSHSIGKTRMMEKLKEENINSNCDDNLSISSSGSDSPTCQKKSMIEEYGSLSRVFKTVMLSKMMSQLTNFSQQIQSIKQFTLTYF